MKKILVIEDQEFVRENILEMLNAAEFTAVGAENGKQGVQLAIQLQPDLILCDVSMPELDGYGVLAILRQNSATATIPFVFLTAKAAKTDMRQGMELGADDYLTKPFTMADLLGAISTQLAKRAIFVQQSQRQLEDLRSTITLSLPHELHTSLNGILGSSQFLIEEADVLEPVEIRSFATDIRLSAERLYRLVQNFLLYAQLEVVASDPGQIQELRSKCTPSAEVVITKAAHQKAAQLRRHHDLQLEVEDISLQLGEDKLQKLIEEVLDNAFKFSAPGTPVKVKGTAQGKIFILVVSDEGCGMSAEQIAAIGAYMRFGTKLSLQDGSGLGLIMARRLAGLHGGDLTIESIPAQETTVRLMLPLAII